MDEFGRGLWRSSSPRPLCKQGQLDMLTQDYVQMTFEYHQKLLWATCIIVQSVSI